MTQNRSRLEMKKYTILLLIFLIGCSSNKHIIKDKKMEDFQFKTSQSITLDSKDNESTADSINNESTSVQVIPNGNDDLTLPEFKFTVFPSDTFLLDNSNQLTFAIIGKESADISLSWQDNSGNWKTVKNGSKVNNIFYDTQYVRENIGSGKKHIKAEILYNPSKPPVILEKSIFIKTKTIEKVEKTSSINLDLTSALFFDDIYFDLDQWKIPSYKFNSNYAITLTKAVKVLKSDDKINLILSGHTDKSGSRQHNIEISRKRCETVKKMILDFFPVSNRSQFAKRIFVQSQGANDLIIDTKNEVKNQLNRRVSLTLSYNKIVIGSHHSAPTINSNNISSQYQHALKLFYEKDYSDANNIFNTISGKYPQHKLSDNAKWWEGEILFVKNQYSEAVKKYNQVFGLGDGNKEAYAQYRIGCCYKEMNLPGKALIELQTVEKLYPNAKEECVKAQQVIRAISQ